MQQYRSATSQLQTCTVLKEICPRLVFPCCGGVQKYPHIDTVIVCINIPMLCFFQKSPHCNSASVTLCIIICSMLQTHVRGCIFIQFLVEREIQKQLVINVIACQYKKLWGGRVIRKKRIHYILQLLSVLVHNRHIFLGLGNAEAFRALFPAWERVTRPRTPPFRT